MGVFPGRKLSLNLIDVATVGSRYNVFLGIGRRHLGMGIS